MRAFRPVEGGYASAAEAWERELLARLAQEVGAVLEAGGTDGGAGSASTALAGGSLGPSGSCAGESGRDRGLLAALERDLVPEGDRASAAAGETLPAEVVELLEVLLPDASEDPLTAVEVGALTRERLRQDKAGRLERVVKELRSPSRRGEVLVPQGEEAQWLGALNDVRLVLAHRLGIESAQDAEDVHAQAFEDPPEDETFHQQWRRGTALVYDMLTWWQESLVSVLLGGAGSA